MGAISSCTLYFRATALFFLDLDINTRPFIGQGAEDIHQGAGALQPLHLQLSYAVFGLLRTLPQAAFQAGGQ